LREFGEHSRVQLHRFLFVERNARHTGDGIAVQRRQSLNDVKSAPVGYTALTSASTLPWFGSTPGHDGSIPNFR
jgi:hypothetical protein